MIDPHHGWNVSRKPLLVGCVGSAALTLAALTLGGVWALVAIVLQAALQCVCFLHVGVESKPHWNLIMFLFMLLVFTVVIGGSLWIMYSLNYTMAM